MIPKNKNPIKFSSPKEMRKFSNIGICGISGVGKTHLAGTVGPDDLVLHFDIEGGSASYNSASFLSDDNAVTPENIHVVNFNEFTQANQIIQAIEGALDYLISSKNEPGYKLVVIDSLTDLQEMFLKLANFKDPRQAYGAFKESLYNILLKSQRVEAHVLYLARPKFVEDPVQDREIVRFDVAPSVWNVVSGRLDAIGYYRVEVQGVRSKRVLDFGVGAVTQGKDRYGINSLENPTMTKVLEMIEKPETIASSKPEPKGFRGRGAT